MCRLQASNAAFCSTQTCSYKCVEPQGQRRALDKANVSSSRQKSATFDSAYMLPSVTSWYLRCHLVTILRLGKGPSLHLSIEVESTHGHSWRPAETQERAPTDMLSGKTMLSLLWTRCLSTSALQSTASQAKTSTTAGTADASGMR